MPRPACQFHIDEEVMTNNPGPEGVIQGTVIGCEWRHNHWAVKIGLPKGSTTMIDEKHLTKREKVEEGEDEQFIVGDEVVVNVPDFRITVYATIDKVWEGEEIVDTKYAVTTVGGKSYVVDHNDVANRPSKEKAVAISSYDYAAVKAVDQIWEVCSFLNQYDEERFSDVTGFDLEGSASDILSAIGKTIWGDHWSKILDHANQQLIAPTRAAKAIFQEEELKLRQDLKIGALR